MKYIVATQMTKAMVISFCRDTLSHFVYMSSESSDYIGPTMLFHVSPNHQYMYIHSVGYIISMPSQYSSLPLVKLSPFV